MHSDTHGELMALWGEHLAHWGEHLAQGGEHLARGWGPPAFTDVTGEGVIGSSKSTGTGRPTICI